MLTWLFLISELHGVRDSKKEGARSNQLTHVALSPCLGIMLSALTCDENIVTSEGK